jgi:hypothetical protein
VKSTAYEWFAKTIRKASAEGLAGNGDTVDALQVARLRLGPSPRGPHSDNAFSQDLKTRSED